MKIYAMFGVYKNVDGNTPELLTAWDEYAREENPDGYDSDYQSWSSDRDLAAFAVVTFEVDEVAVRGALFPPPVAVAATVVDDSKAGAR